MPHFIMIKACSQNSSYFTSYYPSYPLPSQLGGFPISIPPPLPIFIIWYNHHLLLPHKLLFHLLLCICTLPSLWVSVVVHRHFLDGKLGGGWGSYLCLIFTSSLLLLFLILLLLLLWLHFHLQLWLWLWWIQWRWWGWPYWL